jgi:hypothetical protein
MECEEQLDIMRRENGRKDKEIYFLREENIKVIKMLENYEAKIHELQSSNTVNMEYVDQEDSQQFEDIKEVEEEEARESTVEEDSNDNDYNSVLLQNESDSD